jgi:hypothetical protein
MKRTRTAYKYAVLGKKFLTTLISGTDFLEGSRKLLPVEANQEPAGSHSVAPQ